MLKRVVIACFVFLALWAALASVLIDYLTVERHLARADAIVVLSGSAEYTKRTRAAATLLKNGYADRVIITNDGQRGGWDPVGQRNPFFVELAIRNLLDEGVDVSDIEVLPGVVQSTYEEGEAVISTAEERGYRSIILVTSGYHTRRAVWSFERSAERRHLAVDFGVESSDDERHRSGAAWWWLSLAGWQTVGAELPKHVYYRLVY